MTTHGLAKILLDNEDTNILISVDVSDENNEDRIYASVIDHMYIRPFGGECENFVLMVLPDDKY